MEQFLLLAGQATYHPFYTDIGPLKESNLTNNCLLPCINPIKVRELSVDE